MLNAGMSEISDKELSRLGNLQAGFAEVAPSEIERSCALEKLRLICLEISVRQRRGALRLIESEGLEAKSKDNTGETGDG